MANLIVRWQNPAYGIGVSVFSSAHGRFVRFFCANNSARHYVGLGGPPQGGPAVNRYANLSSPAPMIGVMLPGI